MCTALKEIKSQKNIWRTFQAEGSTNTKDLRFRVCLECSRNTRVQCVWKGSCERGVLGDKVGDGASALTLENAEQREANT